MKGFVGWKLSYKNPPQRGSSTLPKSPETFTRLRTELSSSFSVERDTKVYMGVPTVAVARVKKMAARRRAPKLLKLMIKRKEIILKRNPIVIM